MGGSGLQWVAVGRSGLQLHCVMQLHYVCLHIFVNKFSRISHGRRRFLPIFCAKIIIERVMAPHLSKSNFSLGVHRSLLVVIL